MRNQQYWFLETGADEQITIHMNRVGFKMKLNKGQEEEYRRRHEAIWPELVLLLKETGIFEYSIFLDTETNFLFGFFKIENETALPDLPKHPVMQLWWTYMKDIMEANPDHSPVSISLKEVFYLP